jgi:hypothetical protein
MLCRLGTFEDLESELIEAVDSVFTVHETLLESSCRAA